MQRSIVVLRIRRDTNFTIRQMEEKMIQYSKSHSDREMFFDGDRYALCSIQKKGQKN
ncbi:hypothetical protein OXIME_001290 [Oxyplasma meridianum]|uniref:Uncharacterized protein n=1 Tax=Oxyplasma meridianum TaxID=3073602 RepID=A0AAX4NIN4_9ARCH